MEDPVPDKGIDGATGMKGILIRERQCVVLEKILRAP